MTAGPLLLSSSARTTAGVIYLTILFVEYGGLFILRIVKGLHPVTPFQKAFMRAGHGHAGVLVILALVSQLFADAAGLSGVGALLGRSAIPLAAILMPAGFFLSAASPGATKPNRFIVLVYLGALSLSLGVGALGIGLLTSG